MLVKLHEVTGIDVLEIRRMMGDTRGKFKVESIDLVERRKLGTAVRAKVGWAPPHRSTLD